ncbi:hypothetical protein L1049_002912 [Liquidambar formosana]|uniref:Uncharacterized protein n=1 Tax=Liquidambar formosana TaxID=63359 RepID=A0AAP0NL98_LIQFO
MAVNSCDEVQGEGVYTISVLPDDGTTNAQIESQIAILSFVEVPNPFKSQMCLDDQLNCPDCIDLQTENADAYSSCTVDIDIEKGNIGTPRTNEETIGSLKTEGVLTNLQRVWQRQISLQVSGKFMQLIIDHGLPLFKFTSRDKSATERVHDTPNNRVRKYKRAASFDSRKIDSRKIVLLFSVLSSMGTLILIYLTLRVRQIGDGSVPV